MRALSEKVTIVLLILIFSLAAFIFYVHGTRYSLHTSPGGAAYRFDRMTGRTWLVTPYGLKTLWPYDPEPAATTPVRSASPPVLETPTYPIKPAPYVGDVFDRLSAEKSKKKEKP